MKKLMLCLLLAASCNAAAVYEYTFSDVGGSGYGFGPSLLPSPVFISLIVPGPLNTQFGHYYSAELESMDGVISVIAFGGNSNGPLFQDGIDFTVPEDGVGTFFGTQRSAFGANGPYVLTVTATPEPSIYALLGIGGILMELVRRANHFRMRRATVCKPEPM
jgi:hypothetical protein